MDKTEKEAESYIARVPIRGVIIIRKGFRENGYVKISKISKQELNSVFEVQEKSAREELVFIKKQKELQEHLTKLRSLRDARKRIL